MAEQRNIHTLAIVLKKQPLNENDLRITLYSPDLGKIYATAKGGRKITSSMGGQVETFNICQFQLYKSTFRYTIIQCQVEEHFKKIRDNFDRTMIAGLILEIFQKSTLSSEHSFDFFKLFQETLYKISDHNQHFLTLESFKLNLLHLIGVLPDLENCVSCHDRWANHHQIWLEPSGHLHCQNCLYPETTTAKRIEFNIIKLIHYLIQPFPAQTQKIAVNQQQKEQLRHLTNFFLQHFLDQEIISEKMLMQFEPSGFN